MLGRSPVGPLTAQAWASAGSHTPGRGHFHVWDREPRSILTVCFSMQSSVAKRSVVVGKHKTSVSLEDEFWMGLKEIAASRRTTCSALLSELNEHRQSGNLSSAIRQFVLHHYQERARQSEHAASPS
jgi:predicted DNA-binding ribbon-helix-helix protein